MLVARLLLAVAVGFAFAACADGESRTATPTAPVPSPARVLRHDDPARPELALVIDPGASPGASEEGVGALLEVLREDGARVSFAITGAWAERHPGALNAIAREGHHLVNGTYEGRSWTGVSTGSAAMDSRERALSLSRTETTVYRLALRTTRPYAALPYGDIDEDALTIAASEGITTIVVPVGHTPSLTPGGIVGFDAAVLDDASLRALLRRAGEGGLAVVSVEEIDR